MNKIGKKEYEMLLDLYEVGARVEAINVCGVPENEKGYVKRVRKNGDIEVRFDEHGDVVVCYPEDVVRVVYDGRGCMLRMKRGGEDAECYKDCSICGWNPLVEKKRKDAIRDGKLVRGKDGLARIVLRRHEDLTRS